MSRVFTTKLPITVYRLTAESGSKEAYSGTANGIIYGYITGIAPEDTMISEGNPAQLAVLLTEVSSDIKKGDKVVSNGVTYIVKGIKTPTRLFTVAVKRCVIERMLS